MNRSIVVRLYIVRAVVKGFAPTTFVAERPYNHASPVFIPLVKIYFPVGNTVGKQVALYVLLAQLKVVIAVNRHRAVHFKIGFVYYVKSVSVA